MTPLEREWERQRRTLLRQQRIIDKELVLGFKHTYGRLQYELNQFREELGRLQLLGKPIPESKIYKIRRFEELLEQIERETYGFTRSLATEAIANGQRSTLAQVNSHNWSLTEAALAPAAPRGALVVIENDFVRLDVRALQRFIGIASDGQPLGDLLGEIGPSVKKKARQELLYGLTRGQNPNEIARSFKKIASIPLDRALNVSRTEVLRAYRSAALESYQVNEDVVVGWTWMAELSTRTCPACWAMHGTEHSHSESFDSHPRCRCSPIPRTKTWAELGFPGVEDVGRNIGTGADRFANLTAAEQRQILGPGKYDLYREGVPFEKFAKHSHSDRWGGMYREATVAEARR